MSKRSPGVLIPKSGDKKLYTLEGYETELSKLAGQKVIVKGAANGETITVQSVVAAK